MTHVSEAAPSAPHNVGPIWGFFGEIDRTKWQWQAPTPRTPTEDKSATALPAWLLEWDTVSQEKVVEPVDAALVEERPLQQHIRCHQFREAIRQLSEKGRISKASFHFTQRIKRDLSLGLMSQETLDSTLRFVSEDLRSVYPKEQFESFLLAFCTQVRDGLVESKVIGPADIDANVMNTLFSVVTSLPLSPAVKELAQQIVHIATDDQVRYMGSTLTSLVTRWMKSWRKRRTVRSCAEEIRFAESVFKEAVNNVETVRTLMNRLDKGPSEEVALGMMQEAIANAHAAIGVAIDATVDAQDARLPLQNSVKSLARLLAKVPAEMLLELVPEWSEQLFKSCAKEANNPGELAYLWLCVVARLPDLSFELLIQTWRQVDPLRRLRQDKCSEVILEHWISQGKVAKPAALRNTFDVSVEPSTIGVSWSFARLLLALDKHREQSFARTKDLFDLLYKLDRPRHIPETLSRMKELNLKIPTGLLAFTVENMSSNTNMARRSIQMWHTGRRMKLGHGLRPDFVPKFIINLIDSPYIPTTEIWKVLDIPIYEDLLDVKFQPHQAKPLPQEMIDLIHQMATAFAHSKVRPPRLAFRNIIQCLHHLRIHNTAVSPELTRAVNHCYVTGSVLRGLRVGQERLRYCLYLISQVEGEDVAKKVDRTVFQWRQLYDKKSKSEKRKAYILGTGPIR